MKTKNVEVNGVSVACAHEVKTDEAHRTTVHVTVKAGDGADAVELTHILTIGGEDQPLPLGYDQTSLQKDLDEFRNKISVMAESKLRTKKLAQQLQ